MLFLFRSAPEVEKRIHSKLFRKFWRSRGTEEPAYITVQERERKVKVSHLIFHVFDYFVMLSIIYLPFDVVNDSFSVNLLSSVLFHPSTSTREREER